MPKCEYSQKSQTIRLLDVFAIGPLIIYAGSKGENFPDLLRFVLIGTGVATIIYNGNNYLKNKKNPC